MHLSTAIESNEFEMYSNYHAHHTNNNVVLMMYSHY